MFFIGDDQDAIEKFAEKVTAIATDGFVNYLGEVATNEDAAAFKIFETYLILGLRKYVDALKIKS